MDSLDDSQERTTIEARIVHRGQRRDFFGFNRAKHAVLGSGDFDDAIVPAESGVRLSEEFRKLSVIVGENRG